jgi:hypothetical protein
MLTCMGSVVLPTQAVVLPDGSYALFHLGTGTENNPHNCTLAQVGDGEAGSPDLWAPQRMGTPRVGAWVRTCGFVGGWD